MKKIAFAVHRLKVVVDPKPLSELTPISHAEGRVVQYTHLAFEQYHYVAEEVPTKPQFAVVRIEQVPYDRRLLLRAPRAERHCDDYRVSMALEELEHENPQDRASDR